MANLKDGWINERMKRLYAMQFCPRCGLLPSTHDDYACDMHYEEDTNEENKTD
jgi:ribosomal protein S27AE